jgi:hypothetical protein
LAPRNAQNKSLDMGAGPLRLVPFIENDSRSADIPVDQMLAVQVEEAIRKGPCQLLGGIQSKKAKTAEPRVQGCAAAELGGASHSGVPVCESWRQP